MGNEKPTASAPRGGLYWVLRKLLGGAGILFALVLILLSLFLHASGNTVEARIMSCIPDLIKETGYAVLISVLIGFTLDQVQKKELMEEFSAQIKEYKDSSFKALFQWLIPKDLLGEVEGQIFRKGLVRRKGTLDYVLKELDESTIAEVKRLDPTCARGEPGGERILMEIAFKYEIHNFRSTDDEFDVMFSIEKEDAKTFNSLTSASIMDKDGRLLEIRQDALKPLAEFNGNEKIDNVFKIATVTVPADSFLIVKIEARAIRARKHTREVFTSLCLSNSFEVTVYNDLKTRDIDIYGKALAPHNMTLAQSTPNKCWVYRKPLLPGQGVMVWWHQPASFQRAACATTGKKNKQK